ncbi:CBS domain-containing protein [Streptomyces sp. NPDC050508]|uniref:CBS domain-containing protein n=1 Tax=Streptomyces sp. NPDC050508 TaxID=3155405 RepID=UPI003439B73E
MEYEELIKEAKKQSKKDPIQIRITDLLGYWDAKRRGQRILDSIAAALQKEGLTTFPPLGEGWLGGSVQIVAVPQPDDSDDLPQDELVPEKPVGLTLGSLESANSGVASVTPNDSLVKAQSKMMADDYSQLAVMSGERSYQGAVSWESIAQAILTNPDCTLRDAIVSAPVVKSKEDLLGNIPKIIEFGYVFVQSRDGKIQGIVTTADLSNQFSLLASPFFLLAEIERRLRKIIDGSFEIDDLKACVAPEEEERKAGLTSADDLSMGEYMRLLEHPNRWEKLGWQVDRSTFIKALDSVREIRNEVMHFSPDPLLDDQNARLVNFLKWLRKLRPAD